MPRGAEGDSRNVYAKRKVEVVVDEGAGVVNRAGVDCWWEEVLGVEVEGLLRGGENSKCHEAAWGIEECDFCFVFNRGAVAEGGVRRDNLLGELDVLIERGGCAFGWIGVRPGLIDCEDAQHGGNCSR